MKKINLAAAMLLLILCSRCAAPKYRIVNEKQEQFGWIYTARWGDRRYMRWFRIRKYEIGDTVSVVAWTMTKYATFYR